MTRIADYISAFVIDRGCAWDQLLIALTLKNLSTYLTAFKYLMKKKNTHWCTLVSIGILALPVGCASTTEIPEETHDPLEGYNRLMYNVNDKLDKAVLKPVAKGYKAVMPELLDTGVTNFFSNLNDVVVTFNDLLQFKLKQAAMDGSRVAYNTTFGILGFFDVASHMDLPKHEEDFGQTLGVWGVGEGYYLVLPLLGPSTTRDAPGLVVDSFVDPQRQFNPARTRWSMRGVNLVDKRANLLQAERVFGEAAVDQYTFVREAYLQRRRNLVYDGNPPKPKFEDFEDDIEDNSTEGAKESP